MTESRKPSSSLGSPYQDIEEGFLRVSFYALIDGPHCISMQVDSCNGCVLGEPCCWDKAPTSFCQSLGECDQSHPNYLDCRKTCGNCCVQEKIGEAKESWQLLEHCLTTAWGLPDTFLMTAWQLLDDCLTTTWWLPEDSLTTAWQLPDDCLTSAWRLPDDCLMTAWRLPDDCLTSAWQVHDDCMTTDWWLPENQWNYFMHTGLHTYFIQHYIRSSNAGWNKYVILYA